MDDLEPVDIEEYLEYLKVYRREDDEVMTNGEKGLARKMSALRSFYAYYHKHQYISHNPTLLVDMPKQHEKAIIRLDADEVALLLDHVEPAENLCPDRPEDITKRQKKEILLFSHFFWVQESVFPSVSDLILRM